MFVRNALKKKWVGDMIEGSQITFHERLALLACLHIMYIMIDELPHPRERSLPVDSRSVANNEQTHAPLSLLSALHPKFTCNFIVFFIASCICNVSLVTNPPGLGFGKLKLKIEVPFSLLPLAMASFFALQAANAPHF